MLALGINCTLSPWKVGCNLKGSRKLTYIMCLIYHGCTLEMLDYTNKKYGAIQTCIFVLELAKL